MINYVKLQSEADLLGVLALQKQNLAQNLSPEEIAAQGFVTVVHSFETLKKMNQDEASILAKDADRVVGYCLAMTRKFKNDIPELVPMFEQMDGLEYENKKIAQYNYIVSGQVCVDKAYRGSRVLDKMYAKYQEEYTSKYDLILTEIAQRNQRSLKVHLRIGFEILKTFKAENGETWEIVVWNWNK